MFRSINSGSQIGQIRLAKFLNMIVKATTARQHDRQSNHCVDDNHQHNHSFNNKKCSEKTTKISCFFCTDLFLVLSEV